MWKFRYLRRQAMNWTHLGTAAVMCVRGTFGLGGVLSEALTMSHLSLGAAGFTTGARLRFHDRELMPDRSGFGDRYDQGDS